MINSTVIILMMIPQKVNFINKKELAVASSAIQ